MRHAVLATKHAAGAMARAVAGGVGKCGLFGFQHQIERDAEAAAKLAVAARARAKFMVAEMQRKPHFGDFDAAELDAAHGVPFADRRPAVAARRGAAAGPGLKHVPDEISPRAWILALDRNPEAASPAGHRAFRTRGRHRLDDRLDDLVRGMAGAERYRASRIGPDDGALFGDYPERPQRAGVLRDLGVDQIGERHHHGGLHIGMRGIHKARRLRIGVRQIDLDIAARLRDLRGDPDVVAAVTVIVEKSFAMKHAVLPGRDHRARLGFGGVQNRFDRGLNHRRAEF